MSSAEPLLSDDWLAWDREHRPKLVEIKREARELANKAGVPCCGTCQRDDECEVYQATRERVRTHGRTEIDSDPATQH